jgi:hypothetical protein
MIIFDQECIFYFLEKGFQIKPLPEGTVKYALVNSGPFGVAKALMRVY